MSQLPAPRPLVTSANESFWNATADGRLVLQKCSSCDTVAWPIRRHCPTCWTETLVEFDASGRGKVYSFTVVRKGRMDYKDASPFVVAYVELDEGPRVMTNIVECEPDEVAVDMPVEVVFHDTGHGQSLYRFRLVR
ncbi:MAG: hypothetical protein RLY50_285 [Actinomycetota bacterium]|jgi:uncharacterized OB-fold protein